MKGAGIEGILVERFERMSVSSSVFADLDDSSSVGGPKYNPGLLMVGSTKYILKVR